MTKLDLNNRTSFQKKVLEVVKTIPYGETRTYRWVAERIGNPKAARAVGQALKRNPYPEVIPCHRVIRSDGKVGGYSKGIQKKRKLLKKEEAIG
ncbi:Methylated-DNA--protein-cysteine methyltransferase [subsurface metagenome]